VIAGQYQPRRLRLRRYELTVVFDNLEGFWGSEARLRLREQRGRGWNCSGVGSEATKGDIKRSGIAIYRFTRFQCSAKFCATDFTALFSQLASFLMQNHSGNLWYSSEKYRKRSLCVTGISSTKVEGHGRPWPVSVCPAHTSPWEIDNLLANVWDLHSCSKIDSWSPVPNVIYICWLGSSISFNWRDSGAKKIVTFVHSKLEKRRLG